MFNLVFGVDNRRALFIFFQLYVDSNTQAQGHSRDQSPGYKIFFMLNSIEHEIFPAHKC